MPGGFGRHVVYRGILEEPVYRSYRTGIQRLSCQLPAHKERNRQEDRHVRCAMDTAIA